MSDSIDGDSVSCRVSPRRILRKSNRINEGGPGAHMDFTQMTASGNERGLLHISVPSMREVHKSNERKLP